MQNSPGGTVAAHILISAAASLTCLSTQAEVGTLRAELEVQRRAAQQAEQARRIAAAAAESAHAELQTLRAELEQFQRKVGAGAPASASDSQAGSGCKAVKTSLSALVALWRL
jgi:hypothetical protein